MSKELESHLRRAIIKLEETRKELKALKQANRVPIAIIGMSCRLPGGANSPQQFWDRLLDARPLSSNVPSSRWNKDLYYSKDRNAVGTMYTTKAGFIDDIDLFDASFFNISRREALMMDPQQRLLLEETWQAFEFAGIAIDSLKGSNTAVYFGCGSHDYANHLSSSINKDDITAYYGTGNSSSVMAGRVAYIFGFHGPAVTLDTSCSSSLVAVHLACQELRCGTSSLAVVGGVNAILTPDVMINFCKANMLAEDGLSKTFDHHADGYARGEGVGVLILKRLDDALRDKDSILACIIGDGVNHDGSSSSLTSPNGEAQIQLLEDTLKQFAISPQSIDYVEAHGTGTPLGDPIEINALNHVFANSHHKDKPLYIGSVKTNIGHLEAGAGISGMIKVILSMMHKTIPAHNNLTQLNSLIDQSKIPFVIPQQAIPWEEGESARRATVSSFGFSGTNAFVILEESSQKPALFELIEPDCYPVIISAKTKSALMARVAQLQTQIDDTMKLADLAYTLNTGRVQFEHALLMACENTDDLRNKLEHAQDYYHVIANNESALLLFRMEDLQDESADRIIKALTHTHRSFKEIYGQINKQLLDMELPEYASLQLKFSLIYSLFDLFSTWHLMPDFIQGDDSIKAIYYAYVGALSVEQAFKVVAKINPLNDVVDAHQLVDEVLFIEEEDAQTIDEAFVQVNLFNAPKQTNNNRNKIKDITIFADKEPVWFSIVTGLLKIHSYCGSIDWKRVSFGTRLILPPYPFERKRYWHEPSKDSLNKPLTRARSFLLRSLSSPLAEHQFIAVIDLDKHSFLLDHTIYQQILMPAAGLVELMYACLQEIGQADPIELRQFQLLSPLVLKQEEETNLLVCLQNDNIDIYQQDSGNKSTWTKLATSLWSTSNLKDASRIDLGTTHLESMKLPYSELERHDIHYGPKFQTVTGLQLNSKQCLAQIELKLEGRHSLLSILDGAFQAVAAFVLDEINTFRDSVYLPHSFDKLVIDSFAGKDISAQLLLKEKTMHHCTVDIEVYNENNQLLYSVANYRAQKVGRLFLQQMNKQLTQDNLYYQLLWHEIKNPEIPAYFAPYQEIDLRTLIDETQLLDAPNTYFELIKKRIQQIDQEQASSKVAIVFLLHHASQIGNEQIIPTQTFFIGLIKSLRLEYSHRSLFCIDLDEVGTDGAAFTLAQIMTFLSTTQSKDMAIRDGKMYQQRLCKYSVDLANSNAERKESTYVILGGTSSICLSLVTRILHSNDGANIILVARAHRSNSDVLRELLSTNRVELITGDLTQTSFVTKLLHHVEMQSSTGFTLIHAAGVIDDALFTKLGQEQINAVVATKLSPMIAIYQACKEEKVILNQVVCLSSVAATFGSHGQTHYAAANAFLEGYMHYLRHQGVNACAVALSPVNESHMAAQSVLLKRYPQIGISCDEAVASLMLALEHDMPPVYSVINSHFIQQIQEHEYYQNLFSSPDKNNAFEVAEHQLAQFVDELADKSHSERVVKIKHFLLAALGRVLQLQENEYNETSGFFDLGMDSIMAIELFDLIQKSIGDRVKLNNTLLFDLPNIAVLTDYLVKELFPERSSQNTTQVREELSHRVDKMSNQDLLREIELMSKGESDSHEL